MSHGIHYQEDQLSLIGRDAYLTLMSFGLPSPGGYHHNIWAYLERQPIQHTQQTLGKVQAAPDRPAPMKPFSHIQMVHRQGRQEKAEDQESSPVFRRPSLSQQIESGDMAAYKSSMNPRGGRGIVPNAPASLATLASGTTFAAAARAAELNAVKASRQRTQDAAFESEVPDIEPISLGALKFTKSRRGGSRAGKTSNLNELPESSEDESVHRPLTNQADDQSKMDQGRVAATYGSQFGGSSKTDDKRAVTYDSHGTFHLPVPTPKSPIQTSFSRTARPLDDNDYHSGQWRAPLFKPAEMPVNKQPSGGHHVKEPAYSRHPYVSPSSVRPETSNPTGIASQSRSLHNDDPFTEQIGPFSPHATSASKHSSSQQTGFQGQHYPWSSTQYHNHQVPQQSLSSGQPVTPSGQNAPPPAMKGTMDFSFRFPHAQNSMNTQSLANHGKPNTEAKSNMVPAVPKQPQNPAGVNQYPRDPKPYSTFSTTSKKEMLLQNLHEVVESSKAKGNLPNSTRTVLYDPVARQADNQSRLSTHPYRRNSEPDIESLKASDPLPWKDRPVDIFTPSRYNEQDWSAPPAFPPGLAQGNEYIYSLAQHPKPVERSMDELQRWWTTDNRAQGVSQFHLDQINQAQRRRSMASSFESLSSPTSTRTGSSIAPIGSERSSHRATTAGSAAVVAGSTVDNEGMAHLLRAALVNLQSYVDGADNGNDDYFGRFARVPEWCIDKSPGGNDSYFGDWGSPPSRVGRDPRYRPTFHEGRCTVFEELGGRGGRENMVRRLR